MSEPLSTIDDVAAFAIRRREEEVMGSELPVEAGGPPETAGARAWSALKGVASMTTDALTDPKTWTDLGGGMKLGLQSAAIESQLFIHEMRQAGATPLAPEDTAEPAPGSDPAGPLAAPKLKPGKDPLPAKEGLQAAQAGVQGERDAMSTAGQVGAGLGEWAALAIPFTAAMQVGGVPSYLAWVLGSAVGGTIGRDPKYGTIGNVVQEMTGEQADPTLEAFRRAIIDTVAVDGDDSYFEKKLKLATEDVALGLAGDAVMKSMGGMVAAGRATLGTIRKFAGSTQDLPGLAASLRARADRLEAELVDENANNIAYLHAGLPLKGTPADPRALKAKSLRAAAEVADSVTAIRAYHGSPHDFEAFDMTKIGTGEGAQAYGHGLYFASSEQVANFYRASLADRAFSTRSGTVMYGEAFDLLKSAAWGVPGTHEDQARAIADQVIERVAKHGTAARVRKEYAPPAGFELQWNAALDAADVSGLKANKGVKYTVDITAKPEDFVNLDAALEGQTGAGAEALRKIVGDNWRTEAIGRAADLVKKWGQRPGLAEWAREGLARDAADIAKMTDPKAASSALNFVRQGYGTGSNPSMPPAELMADFGDILSQLQAAEKGTTAQAAYDYASRKLGGAEAVSKRMKELGAPGMKYRDAATRGKDAASYNFVVFDDSKIKIVSKEAK